MSSKSRRPVLFRVVLAVSVVAGVLIVHGAPAMADDHFENAKRMDRSKIR